jgi:flagellar protein FliO/FliZ
MPDLGTCGVLATLPAAADLGGTSGPDLTRYLLVCGCLLVLVALLAFGFRRLVGRTLATRAARRSLQVVDVLPLGGKQRLAVVRCYDRTFLLGLGDKELASIAELDRADVPEREVAPARADLHAFAQVLDKLRHGVRPGPRAANAARATIGDEGILG